MTEEQMNRIEECLEGGEAEAPRLRRLRKALIDYGEHQTVPEFRLCRRGRSPHDRCICGLDAAIEGGGQ